MDRAEELSVRLATLAGRRMELLAELASAQAAWRAAVEAGQDAAPHDEAIAAVERQGLALDREHGHLAGLLDVERERIARVELEAEAEEAGEAAQAALAAYRAAAGGYRAVFGRAVADFAGVVRTVCEARAGLVSSRGEYEQATAAHTVLLGRLGVPPQEWPGPVPDLMEQLAQRLIAEAPDLMLVFNAAVDAGWCASELGGYLFRQIDIQHAAAPGNGRLDHLVALERATEAVHNIKGDVA